MSLTFNTKVFTADSFAANAVNYAGPAHTLSIRDDLLMTRQAARETSVFSGVGRFRAKLGRTLTLTGAKTTSHEGILDLSGSMPVGAAGADIDAMVNDFAALLALAAFKTVAKNLLITY
jgi:hypothetical protein